MYGRKIFRSQNFFDREKKADMCCFFSAPKQKQNCGAARAFNNKRCKRDNLVVPRIFCRVYTEISAFFFTTEKFSGRARCKLPR